MFLKIKNVWTTLIIKLIIFFKNLQAIVANAKLSNIKINKNM